MIESNILRRYTKNPVLTTAAFPRLENSVFNAGAVKWNDQYILLTRVEDLSGSSNLWVARSQDGLNFVPDPQPALLPAKDGVYGAVENCSIEDPHITQLDGWFYITYVGYSIYDCVSLSPIAPEDFQGNVSKVVFTCGAILEESGELKVYYDAADQVICLASAPVVDVIALCLQELPERG